MTNELAHPLALYVLVCFKGGGGRGRGSCARSGGGCTWSVVELTNKFEAISPVGPWPLAAFKNCSALKRWYRGYIII